MAQASEVHRRRHPGPRGARAGPQATGHVHRRHRQGRLSPPAVGGRRQLDRRGHQQARDQGRSHAAQERQERAPSRTTVAAFPSTSCRSSRRARSRSSSRRCTPAASSIAARATRCRAACTASARPSSTRCRASSIVHGQARRRASRDDVRARRAEERSSRSSARRAARARRSRSIPTTTCSAASSSSTPS